jgi:hypothetical protein
LSHANLYGKTFSGGENKNGIGSMVKSSYTPGHGSLRQIYREKHFRW